MDRMMIYREIESTLGVVPAMFKAVPDSTLELEWKLFKRTQVEEGAIPNKYRELIGLAVAASSKSPYCTLFHKEAARLNGATEAEIEETLHCAKESAGWGTYVNGLQPDFNEFRREVQQTCDFLRSRTASSKAGGVGVKAAH